MKKVKITIKILGGLKYRINIKRIKDWKTSFFEIDNIQYMEALPDPRPENGEDSWYYSDKQLKEIIGSNPSKNIVLAVINHELEDNYYLRRIGNNSCVLSLYQTSEIILENDLKIEDFIIQNLYFISAVYYRFGYNIPSSESKFTHHDIRGCLFDFNANKEDLIFSLGKVSICDSCKTQFDSTLVPKDFVKNIKKELSGIRKSTYFIIRDWIRRKPILSIIIGVLVTILLNLLSNYLFYIFSSPSH